MARWRAAEGRLKGVTAGGADAGSKTGMKPIYLPVKTLKVVRRNTEDQEFLSNFGLL